MTCRACGCRRRSNQCLRRVGFQDPRPRSALPRQWPFSAWRHSALRAGARIQNPSIKCDCERSRACFTTYHRLDEEAAGGGLLAGRALA